MLVFLYKFSQSWGCLIPQNWELHSFRNWGVAYTRSTSMNLSLSHSVIPIIMFHHGPWRWGIGDLWPDRPLTGWLTVWLHRSNRIRRRPRGVRRQSWKAGEYLAFFLLPRSYKVKGCGKLAFVAPSFGRCFNQICRLQPSLKSSRERGCMPAWCRICAGREKMAVSLSLNDAWRLFVVEPSS